MFYLWVWGKRTPGLAPGGEFPHLSLYNGTVLGKLGLTHGDGDGHPYGSQPPLPCRVGFQRFPELKRHLWKGSLWADGYCANTVGGLNLDAVRHYIQQEQDQTPP